MGSLEGTANPGGNAEAAAASSADRFFERPILTNPYESPGHRRELDAAGQPTHRILDGRCPAEDITLFPTAQQRGAIFRRHVDRWRDIPNPNDWGVTSITARLLPHWRSHEFSSIRPFFCQVEAVEIAIWLTEVAPKSVWGVMVGAPPRLRIRYHA